MKHINNSLCCIAICQVNVVQYNNSAFHFLPISAYRLLCSSLHINADKQFKFEASQHVGHSSNKTQRYDNISVAFTSNLFALKSMNTAISNTLLPKQK